MHPLDSCLLPKKNTKVVQPQSTHSLSAASTPEIWINRLTRHWSIHKKIGVGYFLAISVAVLGTGIGLIVGEHYEDKAIGKFRATQERYERMDELEKSILEVNLYQQQLTTEPESRIRQQEEISELLASIDESRKFIAELKSDLKTDDWISKEYASRLKTLLQTYDAELKAYTQLVQSLSQKVESSSLTLAGIQSEKQRLGMTNKGELIPKFKKLSRSLEELVRSNSIRREQARKTMRTAKLWRVTIIVASMALSVAIAVALAYYTSRAIARRIRSVTKIAQQATQEGNFNLQAPVLSEDEIGVLATSLNQLIQQVATQIRELQQAQGQLIQSEKMSSLGQMVAGIAHEINNPVSFIYANLDYANNYAQDLLEIIALYQKYYPQPVPGVQSKVDEVDLNFLREDFPKILTSMHVGADRIRQIILSLRNFCHLDEAEMKQVDIHAGIDDTLLILSHRLNQGIKVIKYYDSLPLIECYPAQLNQLFMNLLSNAVDELLEHQELSYREIVIQTKLIQSNQIELRLRDNGLGIAPELKDKIFDPFFTTKPVGKGTGMGLAICYQIVQRHQGEIEVFSEPGQGTEFVVNLPI